MPRWTVALQDLAIDLARDHELECRQLAPEPLEVHHAVVVGRPARATADLLRPVGLEQERAAGGEAALDLGVSARADGARDVRVDADDARPCARLDLELGEVGAHGGDRHAAVGGEPARALEPERGLVHRGHVVAALRQPHRVPPLALGQAQHAPRRQLVCLLAQEVVRLGAERPAFLGVTRVPVGHGGAG
jgi:hypothetical protein